MGRRHLVVLLHSGVRDAYVRALEEVLPEGDTLDFRVQSGLGPGLSAAYHRLWQSEGDEPVTRGGPYDTTTVASFSAGFGYLRDYLDAGGDPDAVVFVDSLHAGLDPDGTARDSQLMGVVRYALRAAEGERVLWLGHTDVPTYGYASTTQVAEELRRLTGYEDRAEPWSYHVRAFDLLPGRTAADYRAEHSRALTEWGPDFVAGAFESMLEQHQRPTQPPARRADGLAAVSLEVALAEHARGVSEVLEHRDRLAAYHRGAERGGSTAVGAWLAQDPFQHEWCASFASWCAFEASRSTGQEPPHRWRCAVRELWADALAAGAAVSIERVRAGEYRPEPGDLLVMVRGVDSYRGGPMGLGHVARIRDEVGDVIPTVDGNKSAAVRLWEYPLDEPRLVGVIAYPGGMPAPEPGLPELETLRRLVVAEELSGVLSHAGRTVLEWIRGAFGA